MYYKDEFGLEINLPRKPDETAVEGFLSSYNTLLGILEVWKKKIKKGSCKNPIVKRSK